MTLYLPENLRWLGWIAGTEWPDGDEDRMWDVARAWETASKELAAVIGTMESAKRASMGAYTEGEGAAQIGVMFDKFLVGEQSIKALSDLYLKLYDTAFDMGTELQAAKLNIIISLVWLLLEIIWAWLFPPTAPAAEAAAITTTRSILRVIEDTLQNFIEKGVAKMGFATKAEIQASKAAIGPGTRTSRYWILDWKSKIKSPGWKYSVPSAKGISVYTIKIGESVLTAGGINAAVQVGQIGQGKRHGFNGKEFGASIMGAAVSTIPGREFARVLGRGSDKFIFPKVDAHFPWRNNPGFAGAFGNAPFRTAMFAHGAVIGAATGAVSNVFSNLGSAMVTGDLTGLASPAGWSGAIARGAIVGGARGVSNKFTPPSADQLRFNAWHKDKTTTLGIQKTIDHFKGGGGDGTGPNGGRAGGNRPVDPQVQQQRANEDNHTQQQRTQEDANTTQQRANEDTQAQQQRDNQRTQEDANTQQQRTQEDTNTQQQRTQEDANTQQQRNQDDTNTQQQRDNQRAQDDAQAQQQRDNQRTQEDANTQQQRTQEDTNTQQQRANEDTQAQQQRDNQRAQEDTQAQQQRDNQRAQDDAQAQQQRDNQRAQEDTTTQQQRTQEDTTTQQQRTQEDTNTQQQRADEDAAIQQQRAQEDAQAQQRGDDAQAQQHRDNQRAQEDAQLQQQRAQEDTNTQQQRAQEDTTTQQQRTQEDTTTQQQRTQDDANTQQQRDNQRAQEDAQAQQQRDNQRAQEDAQAQQQRDNQRAQEDARVQQARADEDTNTQQQRAQQDAQAQQQRDNQRAQEDAQAQQQRDNQRAQADATLQQQRAHADTQLQQLRQQQDTQLQQQRAQADAQAQQNRDNQRRQEDARTQQQRAQEDARTQQQRAQQDATSDAQRRRDELANLPPKASGKNSDSVWSHDANGRLTEYSPSFGAGKDMKAKTRAKWYPQPFVFPGAYTVPTDVADKDDWRLPNSEVKKPAPGGPGTEVAAASASPGGPDKPFELK